MNGSDFDEVASHPGEPHRGGLAGRLNWLRAGVLGANDDIVSTAGLVVGVAGATTSGTAILAAGVAGLSASAVSMALGECVSVSSQRDTERALLANERAELAASPEDELAELTAIYVAKGLRPETAELVAAELTERDPLVAHAEAELRIDPDELTNPWHAAGASALAFTVGALLPLIAILLPGPAIRVPLTFAVVLLALAGTEALSAHLGEARPVPAITRLVLGGAVAMAVTFALGQLVGSA
ncbi:MAG TPA: VIT family protein [Kribbella sp.]